MATKNIFKNLFDVYSPLKTTKELKTSYTNITYKSVDDNVDIRALYNKEILFNYLNEAVVKAAFIKNIALKRSPRTTTTIFELNAHNSRADLCLINHKSEVFEIKTSYDSYSRLNNQLDDYLALFDYLNIIIPQENYQSFIKEAPHYLGVIIYSQNRNGRLIFKTIKKPTLNKDKDAHKQLNELTKKELLSLINSSNYHINKDDIITTLLATKTKGAINTIYKNYLISKYQKRWLFIYDNHQNIYSLDYQWFYYNNLNYKYVYK